MLPSLDLAGITLLQRLQIEELSSIIMGAGVFCFSPSSPSLVQLQLKSLKRNDVSEP